MSNYSELWWVYNRSTIEPRLHETIIWRSVKCHCTKKSQDFSSVESKQPFVFRRAWVWLSQCFVMWSVQACDV